MGPAHETTNGWQNMPKEDLEKAMEKMREMGREAMNPFHQKLQKDRERSIQRRHSQRNR